MGYSNQALMGGVWVVGGDSMLVSRIRSIQLLREADVPGEDFKFVLPGLGPLHTLMNFMKMLLKQHLGDNEGTRVGSLYWMNRKLRRGEIDPEAKNLWVCLDLVKDADEACELAFMVVNEGFHQYEDFRAAILRGDKSYLDACRGLDEMLKYTYVSELR